MRTKQWISACVTTVLMMGVSTAAFAADYEPFTDVEDVCPDCEKPDADELEMADGTTLRGTVVGENTDFYVVVRYGEVRAIPTNAVDSITWADGSKPSGLSDKDQVVLDSGHVVSGTIVDEKDTPAFFQVKSSFADFTYTIFKKQVDKAYKDGSRYEFSMPEEDDE